MERIEIKGLDEALRKLHAMPENVKRFVGRGLYAEAQAVMADSKENYVPVDTGVLSGSGFVKPPTVSADEISVVLGYGGPAVKYALAVHENPRAGKTGGLLPPTQSIAGILARTFGTGAYTRRRKTWAKTGQWKYLEIPVVQATDKFRAVIASAIGPAFEGGR